MKTEGSVDKIENIDFDGDGTHEIMAADMKGS